MDAASVRQIVRQSLIDLHILDMLEQRRGRGEGNGGGAGAGGAAGGPGPQGVKGDKGDPGTDGTNGTNGTNGVTAAGIINTNFTMPAVGGSATLALTIIVPTGGAASSTPALFLSPGQIVFVPTVGYLRVSAVTSTTASFFNDGYPGNIAGGTPVTAPVSVVCAGPIGLAGRFAATGFTGVSPDVPLALSSSNGGNIPWDDTTGLLTTAIDGYYTVYLQASIQNTDVAADHTAQLMLCTGIGPTYTTVSLANLLVKASTTQSTIVQLGPSHITAGTALSFQWHRSDATLQMVAGDATSWAGATLVSLS
jgi:hypothetical protein